MKGLKFIPTATVTRNKIRRQLLQGYKAFARGMRLKYIFHGQNKTIRPSYVNSNWEPPVQASATSEHYTEGVTFRHRRTGEILLGELNIICPNETRWSQVYKMILSSLHRHNVRARAFKIVQIFSVNRDQHF